MIGMIVIECTVYKKESHIKVKFVKQKANIQNVSSKKTRQINTNYMQ